MNDPTIETRELTEDEVRELAETLIDQGLIYEVDGRYYAVPEPGEGN